MKTMRIKTLHKLLRLATRIGDSWDIGIAQFHGYNDLEHLLEYFYVGEVFYSLAHGDLVRIVE